MRRFETVSIYQYINCKYMAYHIELQFTHQLKSKQINIHIGIHSNKQIADAKINTCLHLYSDRNSMKQTFRVIAATHMSTTVALCTYVHIL